MAELVELQPEDEMYEKIFKLTIGLSQNMSIEKIYAIINPTLQSIFEVGKFVIEEEIGGESEVFDLFHGSPEARKIAHEGFDLSLAKDCGIFGKGVYLTEDSYQALDYSTCPDPESDKSDCTPQILLCQCIMGKHFRISQFIQCNKRVPPGFHSSALWITNLRVPRTTYCFPKREQVLPYALIECRRRPRE
ncbi:poly [ADP-ribose] polymerase tankyrase-1-like [Neocloeon triangulifer]|uniref:poly [ADP-ribose] polymerase tankyrase-1-like n=1 Tax=Neocloeon triangulifer TaxID=2078957 RepID=UPI00286F5386|nr:poly [ADP-ribose] polymerase tankyrase-1-like [Neocloeon triangulifer]